MQRSPQRWVAVGLALAGSVGGTTNARSGAAITASFADACRDFEAHSTKDISHVVIHYVDGHTLKDETIDRPDYSLDGGSGDEIASASVKSSTTAETFECRAPGSPPVALLEWRICQLGFRVPGLDRHRQRRGLRLDRPLPESGAAARGQLRRCGRRPRQLVDVLRRRFATANSDWASSPSAEVEHLFPLGCWTVTLTVTDATGLTGTDQLVVCVVDQTPD